MGITVEKFLLCDDIRREDNGKLIIIGLYHEDKIIVRSDFPYRHNNLSFLINVSGDIIEGELTYQFSDPEGKTILETPPMKIPAKNETDKGKANFIAGISQFVFNSAGTYHINIKFPSNEQIKIPFFVEKKEPPNEYVEIPFYEEKKGPQETEQSPPAK